MHPFINSASLSDDQIIDKLEKANQHLAMQGRLGHSDTMESIQAIILTLEEERMTRYQKLEQDEINKQYPDILKTLDIGVTEEIQEIPYEHKQQ